MNQNQQVQPVFIMPQGTQRNQGRNAQRINIMAARMVADTVRTTLGPKGMDKMLVDSMGDIVVTNDGVTILTEMQIDHPAAKMIVEVAKTQEDEVGDGTTTAVVLAGQLLKKSEELLDIEIHPTVIVKGFRMAAEKSLEFLKEYAHDISVADRDLLCQAAMTAMTGKGAENHKEKLANITVDAIMAVLPSSATEVHNLDYEDIKIEKRVGESIEDTEMVQGIVLDMEVVHASMPKKIEGARIALIDEALEVKETETSASIQITSPDQIQEFLDKEEEMLQKMVESIKQSGANVVVCQRGIDELAQHYLVKAGIMAIRRVSREDMIKISKAIGANIVSSLRDLDAGKLGKASAVEERKVGESPMIFIEGCENAKSVTILVRGTTEHVADEAKRAMVDALGDLTAAIKSGKVVAGAGAPEIALSKMLSEYAETLSGREQLAVKAFAEALEIIPRSLAENAGLDPIDILTELKSAHESGNKWAGINVFDAKVMDAWEAGVIEPLKIKTQAISSATEVATMILRIDDVISAVGSPRDEQPQM